MAYAPSLNQCVEGQGTATLVVRCKWTYPHGGGVARVFPRSIRYPGGTSTNRRKVRCRSKPFREFSRSNDRADRLSGRGKIPLGSRGPRSSPKCFNDQKATRLLPLNISTSRAGCWIVDEKTRSDSPIVETTPSPTNSLP